jgi:uncharacterized protein (TIGR02722 family)
MKTKSPLCFAVALALPLAASGCASREVVRDTDDPSINAHAMSTGLDREDMHRALQKLLNQMREAPIMMTWRQHQSPKDVVAIAPFINTTSEHIDSQLDVMLSETETWLVNAHVVSLIDRERQLEMIRQVEGSQHPVFNPQRIPQYGKQLNAKYYITGKVGAADERTEDARRVQYFIFMKVLNVETSEIEWQERVEITKMVR